MEITEIELQFLCAGGESIRRAVELAPAMAHELGLSMEEMYYRWMTTRSISPGLFLGGEWKYFFHGFECNLENAKDGRSLRIGFGPRGRVDTFSGDGVLVYAMTARSPWVEFPELREHLAEKPPPYNKYSGSFARMWPLEQRMHDLGFLAHIAPEIREDPRYANEQCDLGVYSDYMVSLRPILTDSAWRMIESRGGSRSSADPC